MEHYIMDVQPAAVTLSEGTNTDGASSSLCSVFYTSAALSALQTKTSDF